MGKKQHSFSIKYHRNKDKGSLVAGIIELRKYQAPKLVLTMQSTRDHLGSVSRFEKLFRRLTLCLLEEGFTIWKGKYVPVGVENFQQKDCVVCGYPMIGSKGFNDKGEPVHKSCLKSGFSFSSTVGGR